MRQSIASTIYQDRNQYRVIMEVAPRYAQSPAALADVHESIDELLHYRQHLLAL